jgi:hypothetical protein
VGSNAKENKRQDKKEAAAVVVAQARVIEVCANPTEDGETDECKEDQKAGRRLTTHLSGYQEVSFE